MSANFEKITAVVVDVLGTTTSASFAKDTLFPYVTKNVEDVLKAKWDDEDVKAAVKLLKDDLDLEGAVKMVKELTEACSENQGLKTIQGIVYEKGYESGDLKAHVFDDVPKSFETWAAGRKIAIFSTGSVQSQKQLFSKSCLGDVSSHISNYFDQTTGSKTESASYKKISEELAVKPDETLFITDLIEEAAAAKEAGLSVVLIKREGNADLVDAKFPVVSSFADITFGAPKRKIEEPNEEPPSKVAKKGDAEETKEAVMEVDSKSEVVEEKKDAKDVEEEKMEAESVEEKPQEADVEQEKVEEPSNSKPEKVEETESVEATKEDKVEEPEKVEEKTDKVDEKTEKVEEKTEKVEEKTDKVEEKTEKVEEKTEKVEEKAEKVEEKTDKVEEKTEKVQEKVEEKTESVEELKAEVEKKEAETEVKDTKTEEAKEEQKETPKVEEKTEEKTENGKSDDEKENSNVLANGVSEEKDHKKINGDVGEEPKVNGGTSEEKPEETAEEIKAKKADSSEEAPPVVVEV